MNNITIANKIITSMIIRERDDGRLEGRITINSKRKSFYGDSKIEVKQKAKAYIIRVQNGYVDPKRITLNEYLEYWLLTYKNNKIEKSSYSRLCSTYKHQIKDTIGKKYIGNITTKDIQDLVDEKANPTKNDTKALALSGLKKIIHLLNPCFEKAVLEGIIQRNPCQHVILPKETCCAKKTRKQFSLTDEEIKEFTDACLSTYKSSGEYKSRDAFILLLILNLGLRIGEALALTWEDIDLDNNLIYINKTLQTRIADFYGNKNKDIIKDTTKTPSGVRCLKLNDTVVYYINELIAYDIRNNIKSSYVACTNVGTMNTERNLQRSLKRVLGWTNIRLDTSPHTLRHTFGSALIRRGVDVSVVSKLMGHSNISITYNKYIHVLSEQAAKTMEMISIS